jgi:uncharacterized DUF497 family protein
MDDNFELNGIRFIWNLEKARANRAKHEVAFEQAAEAFFDPFVRVMDASCNEEARDALIGMDKRWNLLFVVHLLLEEDKVRIISARKATRAKDSFMKIERLKNRFDRNRPMTMVTLRMPEDVVEDLKRIAPLLGFSGYQPLMRAYIGQGLREDLENLENDTVSALVASLRRRGVSEEVIEEALTEVAHG